MSVSWRFVQHLRSEPLRLDFFEILITVGAEEVSKPRAKSSARLLSRRPQTLWSSRRRYLYVHHSCKSSNEA